LGGRKMGDGGVSLCGALRFCGRKLPKTVARGRAMWMQPVRAAVVARRGDESEVSGPISARGLWCLQSFELFDILVIGATLRRFRVEAGSENWPGVGWLCG